VGHERDVRSCSVFVKTSRCGIQQSVGLAPHDLEEEIVLS
jgi:hypothetical protein